MGFDEIKNIKPMSKFTIILIIIIIVLLAGNAYFGFKYFSVGK